MENTQRQGNWKMYLKDHPKKVKAFLKEAQNRAIADIEERYRESLDASREARFMLKRLVDEKYTLEKIHRKGGRTERWDDEYKQIDEEYDREIERVKFIFQDEHLYQCEECKQRIADCEAAFKELRSLLL